jgi:glutaredoxin
MKEILSYTIFTTPTCHFCHDLKDWLGQKNIPFEAKDVATDLAARQEMLDKSKQMGVPVSLIKFADNTEAVIVGFAPQQLNEVLGLTA